MARRQRRAVAEINVVPYIDVMLVLLVIFMVATPMMQPATVNLPSVDRADRAQDVRPLRVDISREQKLSLIDEGRTERVADVKALVLAVKAKTALKARPVVIAADQDVPYKAVVAVMDGLKTQGVERVGLQVQPQR
ncbi:biopolymer transporter ExbD [Chitinimonas lacunae]|uniref:Biopolymer transporter ExbD n=1 Tax=Chitinimonas lacunae TaxID=1963018 RepID=A0ABV8MTU5_9NEIS